MDHDVDAVVVGVGSGGTLTGHRPLLRAGRAEGRDGARRSEGLDPGAAGDDRQDDRGGLLAGGGHRRGFRARRTAICRWCAKPSSITDAESFATARELLRKEAILAGSSSGTLLAAALRYCREQTDAQARRHLRLRQRQQVSLQDVQRLLDARPGPARPRPAGRSARPDHPAPRRPGDGHRRPRRHPADRLSAHEALRDLAAAGAGRRQGRRHHRRIRSAAGRLWPARALPRAGLQRHERPGSRSSQARPAARPICCRSSSSDHVALVSRAASSSASSPASICSTICAAASPEDAWP